MKLLDACGGEESISHVLSDSLLYDIGQGLLVVGLSDPNAQIPSLRHKVSKKSALIFWVVLHILDFLIYLD